MRCVRRVLFGSAVLLLATTSPARAEGLPDILGIQLGMPVRDAHAKLQTALPKNKIQLQSTNLPTIEKPVIFSLSSAPTEAITMGMEADQVIVDVTLPPNKQAVWRVYRTHYFPGNGIPKTTLLASLREKSLALSSLFIELVESRCAGHGLMLASPRDSAQRGSQASFAHETGGYPIMQALIARGVIGDFRKGSAANPADSRDILRFGFTPLYTRFVDVWDAVEQLVQVMGSGEWRQARFNQRAAVT